MGTLRSIGLAGGFLALLAATPAYAANLVVKAAPNHPVTGYYLVPQDVMRTMPEQQNLLRAKLHNTRRLWLHPLTDSPNLPTGAYVIFPECNDQLMLIRRLISHKEGEVVLRCRQ